MCGGPCRGLECPAGRVYRARFMGWALAIPIRPLGSTHPGIPLPVPTHLPHPWYTCRRRPGARHGAHAAGACPDSRFELAQGDPRVEYALVTRRIGQGTQVAVPALPSPYATCSPAPPWRLLLSNISDLSISQI